MRLIAIFCVVAFGLFVLASARPSFEVSRGGGESIKKVAKRAAQGLLLAQAQPVKKQNATVRIDDAY